MESYQWEMAVRETTRQSTAQGPRVAVLLRRELQKQVCVLARDPKATYIWINLELDRERTIYIAICYFTPRAYAIGTEEAPEGEHTKGGESSFGILSEDILHYSTLGEVFLLGDFNAKTQRRQCATYAMEDPEMMMTMEEDDMGTR